MGRIGRVVGGAAVVVLFASAGAGAQPAAPAGPGGAAPGAAMMGPAMMWPGMMGAEWLPPMMRGALHGMGGQHVEGRIAFLRAELAITEAQAAPFAALAEALRTNARAAAELHEQVLPGGRPPAGLPQRLEVQERMAAAHLAALQRLRAAAGPLYAALDAQQKRLADGLMVGML